jgi:tetratricopeptide (TPR) repeat protein
MAVALNAIGISTNLMNEPAAAQVFLLETLALFRELGDDQAVARTLSNIAGIALELGEIERAAELYEQVRAAFGRLGDSAGLAWTNNLAAQVELARGDRDAALRLYSEALATFRALRDTWGAGDSLLEMAQVAWDQRDLAQAHQRLMEAYGVFAEARDIRGLVRVIEGFVRFAADSRDVVRALTLAGAAAAMRQRLGTPLLNNQRLGLDRALEQVRQDPNARGAGTAWMDGWSMSSEEAVSYAVSAPPPG